MKTARKQESFIEDLVDGIRVTPGFGSLFASILLFRVRHMQSSVSELASLLSEHELEKHDKVA